MIDVSGLVKQYVKTWRAFLRNRISIRFSVFVKWSCPSTSSLISLCSISLFNHERSALCNFYRNQSGNQRINLVSHTIIMMLQIVVVLACLALTLGFNFGNSPRVARNVKFTSLQMSTPEAPAGSYFSYTI